MHFVTDTNRLRKGEGKSAQTQIKNIGLSIATEHGIFSLVVSDTVSIFLTAIFLFLQRSRSTKLYGELRFHG